jgi:hypothetical protein
MYLVLKSGNVIVATKKLTTKEDFNRVGDASLMIYKGQYYSFAGIRVDGNLVEGKAVFEQVNSPVVLDGFIDK